MTGPDKPPATPFQDKPALTTREPALELQEENTRTDVSPDSSSKDEKDLFSTVQNNTLRSPALPPENPLAEEQEEEKESERFHTPARTWLEVPEHLLKEIRKPTLPTPEPDPEETGLPEVLEELPSLKPTRQLKPVPDEEEGEETSELDRSTSVEVKAMASKEKTEVKRDVFASGKWNESSLEPTPPVEVSSVELLGRFSKEPDELPEEERQPRYKALELIDEGAMGEIWKAEDMLLNRFVAIKRRKEKLTPEALELFVEEARTTGRLEHSNIVTIHDMGVDNGGREYMVMRFIEGRTLKDIIAQLREGDKETHREFPLQVRLQLMLQVLSALSYAHNKGIIHRDIKPANIMIGRHQEVTLMDWGISFIKPTAPTRKKHYPSNEMLRTLANQDYFVLLEEQKRKREEGTEEEHTPPPLSLPNMLFGTPAYMAPEQLQADAPTDERTDIYSFCATLYEFLTLRHYLGHIDNLLTMLFNVQNQEPLPAEEVTHPSQGRIPREWGFLLQKGLKKDPRERFQTAEVLLQELQDNLRGYLTVGCTSTLLKQGVLHFLHFLDNHRHAGVALAILFSGLAIFGLFSLLRLLF